MRAINPQKVLLIVNSDDARSTDDADNYVIQRSLNPAHRLAFAWGASNAALTATALKVSIIPTVAAYMAANAIECVILSTYTPTSVNPQVPELPGAVWTLAAWLAASRYLNQFVVGGYPVYWGDITARNTVQQIMANVAQDWMVQNFFGGPRVPHGRLGCPDYNSAALAEVPLSSGGSVFANAVAQARVAEGKDQSSAPHYLTNVLGYSIITPDLNGLALQDAQMQGFPLSNVGSGRFPVSRLEAGSSSAPQSLFALCLAANWNALTISNFRVRQGAWGFNWTSAAGQFGSNLLTAGGSAALLSFGEPYNTQLAKPEEVFVYARYYQVPVALAAFLAYSYGAGYTVCGDPLYAPYAATSPARPIVSGKPR